VAEHVGDAVATASSKPVALASTTLPSGAIVKLVAICPCRRRASEQFS
jgi:hypothetical protein